MTAQAADREPTTATKPSTGGKRAVVGLLTAYTISLTGTRISAVALPWFVLVSTGSATRTGMVVFAEMVPYVIARALTGPAVDQRGGRRVSVLADLASAGLVAAVPVAYQIGTLPFEALLVLVAAIGAARGPADAAKTSLVPDVAAIADVPMERVTGPVQTVNRVAAAAGPAIAAVLIPVTSATGALFVDAVSFALAAACIAGTAPSRRRAAGESDDERYLRRLRAGAGFLRRDVLLASLVAMVSVSNLLDTALVSVLLPVWTHDGGGGPATVGTIITVWEIGGIGGALGATVFAHRLPRRATYFIAFVFGSAPPFLVLTLDVPLWTVFVVFGACGALTGVLNPIISAVMFERIPAHLVGRVMALSGSLAWLGIPLGGITGGALVTLVGLNPALWLAGVTYLLVTTLPGLHPAWRDMDRRRHTKPAPN